MQDLHCLNSGKIAKNPSAELPSLLIVEDDRAFLETLELEFKDRGYQVIAVQSSSQIDEKQKFRFAILDLRVGTESGLSILEKLKSFSPDCRVVILTGYGSISTAIKAVKLGAVNYLTKPVSIESLEKALWVEMSDSEITEAHPSLARHERDYIDYVLQQCEGNITKAAKWLGLHRQSLQRKLKKYPPRV